MSRLTTSFTIHLSNNTEKEPRKGPCHSASTTTKVLLISKPASLIQTEGDSLLCGGITLMMHFTEQ